MLELITPLVRTMAALCHKDSIVLLAYQSRSSAADVALFAALEPHFTRCVVVMTARLRCHAGPWSMLARTTPHSAAPSALSSTRCGAGERRAVHVAADQRRKRRHVIPPGGAGTP